MAHVVVAVVAVKRADVRGCACAGWLTACVSVLFLCCRAVNATNLALHMNTTQSTTAYGGDSFRATDGLVNGYYSQGGVTHTGGLGTYVARCTLAVGAVPRL